MTSCGSLKHPDLHIQGWDCIASVYHEIILGPFMPEIRAAHQSGLCPNPLLSRFSQNKKALKNKSIGDFGSGPGNALAYLRHVSIPPVLIDYSPVSLEYAKKKAAIFDMEIKTKEKDLQEFCHKKSFDLILNINALQPAKREEVSIILKNMAQSLRSEGEIWLVTPSFEALEHLIKQYEYIAGKTFGPLEGLCRTEKFIQDTGYDAQEKSSYFSQIKQKQCLHTLETLTQDIDKAGLKLKTLPDKIKYPHFITSKKWGFYNNHAEPFWNWFLILGPA